MQDQKMQSRFRQYINPSLIQDFVSEKIGFKSDVNSVKIIAQKSIEKDQILFIMSGKMTLYQRLNSSEDYQRKKLAIQIAQGVFSLPFFKIRKEMPYSVRSIQHSCQPNVGILGGMIFVAMKIIEQGEQLTTDYCFFGAPYTSQQVECNCGNDGCRKFLSSDDWKNPALIEKYDGKYFSDFIKERQVNGQPPDVSKTVDFLLIQLQKDHSFLKLQELCSESLYDSLQINQDLTSNKIQVIQDKLKGGGFACKCVKQIKKGQAVVYFGGIIVSLDQAQKLGEEAISHSMQIDDNFLICPIFNRRQQADLINHSCNPNLGFKGQNCLVAMRDIKVGQILSFDYCMVDSVDIDVFNCACGEMNCRKEISGQNWKSKELQERYNGYFSRYLQIKINQMNKNQ